MTLASPLLTRVVLLASVAVSIAACGEDSWFGGDGTPPLPGTRISVLEFANTLEPDPMIADVPVVMPAAYTNADWPQAGVTPEHAPGNLSLALPLERVWTTDIGYGSSRRERLISQPIVADGRVYAMDARGFLGAYDAATGRRLWRVLAASPTEDSQPLGGGVAADGGRLYVTTGFGEVLSIDPANGGLIWRVAASGPTRAAPSIADDRVFVVTVDNQLQSLDAETGETQWVHTGLLETAGLLGGASPAIGSGFVLAPYSSGEIYALRQETGRPAWSDSLTPIRRIDALSSLADIRGLPVLDNGVVFVTSHAGRTAAIDLRTGVRLWEQDFGGINTPIVAGDFVFLITNNNELVAMTRAGGQIRWVTPLARWSNPEDRLGAIVWAGPVLAGDALIAVNTQGDGVVLSTATGEVTQEFSLEGDTAIAPIVANETLYVVTENGRLAAYR